MYLGPKRLFVFGLGYTAEALLRQLTREGWEVAGTTRDRNRAPALEALGARCFPFDRGHPLDEPLRTIGQASHILVTIPPDAEGDIAFDLHGGDIVRANDLAWLGYLSTTGVYGNTDGAEVDEDSPLRPSSPRAQRRVDAEQNWLSLRRERLVPVHIFRLPGIYGPGRSVLDQIREGKAKRIDKPDHHFSRIHVDDIAGVLKASMQAPDPGSIYNVVDDEPAPPALVTYQACQMLSMRPPPLIPFEQAKTRMSDMALSFWNDNRCVSNAKIKRDLGYKLRYPTFREGLAAIVKAERGG
ncbi:MAG: SDR family oxidoreductase [Rhodospirillales bacterium]